MTQDEETTDEELMSAFVKQFYAGTPYLPGEIFLECGMDDMEIVEEWLSKKRGGRVHIRDSASGRKAPPRRIGKRECVQCFKAG